MSTFFATYHRESGRMTQCRAWNYEPLPFEAIAQVDEMPAEGSMWDGEKFVAPQEPAPAPTPTPEPAKIPPIGPIAFQLLFTAAELVACDAAKETDAQVRIFWKLLDDPRTDTVDRNIATVQEAIRHLEAVDCIGKGRADELIGAE